MSDNILKALMRLFASVAVSAEAGARGREVVERFLSRQLSNSFVVSYLEAYDSFRKISSETGNETINTEEFQKICADINNELDRQQKYIVLIRLLEFVNSASSGEVTNAQLDFVKTVAETFLIGLNDYSNCFMLCMGMKTLPALVGDSSSDGNKIGGSKAFRSIRPAGLTGDLIFLLLRDPNLFVFCYSGEDQLFLNGKEIHSGSIHVFEQGSVIRGGKISPLYYNEIIHRFLGKKTTHKNIFKADKVSYNFSGGKIGLHKLSFSTASGNLVGIMGNSGAGKTTMLNLLNGSVAPTTGKIYVNDTDIHDGKKKLPGIIGNIPQDDLMIEELTVFQNLFLSSKLYFGKLTDKQIEKKVHDCLHSLGLLTIKDLVVGDALNKSISGGQRKRLNIALELIREPEILFVDEPTSGLSSADAENVMDLLKQLALTGKLIFVVIHQPSSNIFKLFDQLLILDTGGYPVYFGNPLDSLIYFKKQIQFADSSSECETCGNINSEEIFEVIESKTVDEFGRATHHRKITSAEWYHLFKKNFGEEKKHQEESAEEKKLFVAPEVSGWFTQFVIYLKRNVLSKINNKQYLAITLAEAPILALILGFALRAGSYDGSYSYGSNPNIPVYIFISIIVALFLGLTVSADEVINDRKILKRESFLQLSRSSYLISKIAFLFFVSALQSFLFLLIGNLILGISGLFFHYWLVLFSVSCFANVLGLNISSGMKTRVAVYILIPFLIIPQIMLSGVMVKFEDLSPAVSSQTKVPLIGNIMATRWAYEGLSVDVFKNNEYEKTFFETDKIKSNATYYKDWWAGQIESVLANEEYAFKNHPRSKDSTEKIISFLKNEFASAKLAYPKLNFASLDVTPADKFFSVCRQNISVLRSYLIDEYNKASEQENRLMQNQIEKLGGEKNFSAFKEKYFNNKLDEFVKNSLAKDQWVMAEGKIVRRYEPVFVESKSSGLFSAPFYAHSKSFFGAQLPAVWFNLIIVWLMTAVIYVALYFDWLRKILEKKFF